MKILYFCRINKDDHGNHGVVKKCEAQAAAFRQLGAAVDLIYLSVQGILKNEVCLYEFPFSVLSRRWTTFLFYLLFLLRIVFRKIDLSTYDVIYMRYPMAHPLLMWFLKKAQKTKPSLKIVLEFPTFPYDKEPQGLAHKLSLTMDKWYRNDLVHYVDFIGHYGLEKSIYGIPVVPLRNGVPVEQIPMARSKAVPNTLRLIGVANWSYWHGLDRLIDGLKNYYEQEQAQKIYLKVIGAGKALAEYKEKVSAYGLENYVEFVPPSVGVALDRHFEAADIGVGCLGLFRKEVRLDSSLKTREYCSRGLPFIFSGEDLNFPPDLFFVKELPHQEGAIAMETILDFWETIKSRRGAWNKEIRNYAKTHLSWEKQLGEMMERLKENKQ